MRIVAGTHRSRILETPKNDAIRPTSDKVRGALFNMLNSRGYVTDATVMDVFCGTGALGLEALSQGAAFCTFIDKNKISIDLTKRNIATLKEDERSKSILADGTKLPVRPDDQVPASLIFLDPPYGKDLVLPTLQSLSAQGWMEDGCICVVEESSPITAPDHFEALTQKEYGDTYITVMRYNQPL